MKKIILSVAITVFTTSLFGQSPSGVNSKNKNEQNTRSAVNDEPKEIESEKKEIKKVAPAKQKGKIIRPERAARPSAAGRTTRPGRPTGAVRPSTRPR